MQYITESEGIAGMRELEIIRHSQMAGLSMFFDTVDYRTPHFHQEWELILLLDAPLSVTCGQRHYLVNAGEVVLFSPALTHEFHKVEKSCTFLCVQISSEVLTSIERIVVEDVFPQRFLTAQEDREIKRVLHDVYTAYLNRTTHYELYCMGQIILLMHLLLSRIPNHSLSLEEQVKQDKRNARLNRLLQFVDENYMDKIRLKDFAEQEGYSVGYMSHFVKNMLNQTFQEYVNIVRFNSACEQIAAGKEKLLDICVASGFSDYRYFSRTFKEQVGMTPEEYRRQCIKSIPEGPKVRCSLHSLERFYTREQSLQMLKTLFTV